VMHLCWTMHKLLTGGRATGTEVKAAWTFGFPASRTSSTELQTTDSCHAQTSTLLDRPFYSL
jgi:hypothetical protein